MANFPTSLPSFTNPSAGNYLNSPAHATQHSSNNDETVAVATKVGITGSADTTSIDYKLSGIPASDKSTSLTGTETFTNKRITKRVLSITSSATPTINTDSYDVVDITAQAADINTMSSSLSGTPTNKQTLVFEIKDDGTARAITWGASFVAGGVVLPTTTVLGKILTVGFMYSTANSLNKWRCLASVQEA
jgi:hypothetical protein